MKQRSRLSLVAIVAALIAFAVPGVRTQTPAAPDTRALYNKTEHMVPMRDGVKLFTIVYTPKDQTQPYPFMLHRTPYSSPPYGEAYRSTLGPSADFVREGFIFVYQDVRGKFRSEGEFVVMRAIKPAPRGPRDTDEGTDTWDTVDWLVKNVPNNNGRAGQWGISYPGSQTVWGMVGAHPALKASSPQAPAIDMFLGDDFHHNGAFRLMYTFSWLAGNARPRAGASETRGGGFDYGTPDGYRFFLDAGPVANINEKYFNYSVPTWNEYMAHPDYDEYWERQNPLKHLTGVSHAVLNVAGWFDAEDFYGPLETYRAVERLNPTNQNTLVVGPWLHGGWASMPGDVLGDIQFGSATGDHYRRQIEYPFFLYHLKGKGPAPAAEAMVFETGGNTWKTFDTWPPRGTTDRTLYFTEGGQLSFSPPAAARSSFDEYVSDPAKPVPWSVETRTTQGHLWMIEDQRFAAARPDVLVYRTEPLTEEVTVAGPIIASIFASTSGTDADWIVKLIDVYPGTAPDNKPNPRGIRMGDFQMLLAGEAFRGRYRNSFSKPEAIVPNQPVKYEFDLRDRFHRFLKGHRIMVQVQSSWFPVIDRNPQTFVNIYKAESSDFRKATHRVYRTPAMPSGVKIKVVGGVLAEAQSVSAGKTTDGIAYDVQGSGPVVVLLTGSNLDRRMWAREAKWLAATYTVVQYDLRAHGQSDTATAPFSHLGDLIGLLDELKIAKATLIGLSAGSAIALDAALEIPARVERIVLSGPAPSGYVPKQQLPFANDMIAALKARDYAKVAEVLLATSVFAAPPESQSLVRQMVTENDRLWTVDRALMKGPPQTAMDRLASVTVPTLVLIGDRDEFQREPAELLAERIPGARIVHVPGGGHLLNLTSPKAFQSAVTAFLMRRTQ